MSSEDVKVIISNNDFEEAVKKRKSSVSPELLQHLTFQMKLFVKFMTFLSLKMIFMKTKPKMRPRGIEPLPNDLEAPALPLYHDPFIYYY